MHILRSLVTLLTGSLCRLCLLTLPPLIAIVALVGHAGPIERALQASGIYRNFVPAVLDQSLQNQHNDDTAQTLLKDTGVRKAISDAISPTILQSNSEHVIAGVYGWLEGKTTAPEFTVDLTDARDQLQNNLTAYAEQRAATLPACTATQLQQLKTDQNILDLPCLPPGINVHQAATQFSTDLITNADFLKDPTFSAADLPKDETGRPVYERLDKAPQWYHWLVISPWAVSVLALVLGSLFVLLNEKRAVGLRKLGWTMVGLGIFWLVGVILYAILFRHVSQNLGSIANPAFREAISSAFTQLATTFNTVVGVVAGVYIVLGVICVVVVRRMQPRRLQPATDPAQAVAAQTHDIKPIDSAAEPEASTTPKELTEDKNKPLK